ncbi:hypothetical protein [Antrihabitans spumae]|uniref:MCE family protein n=1 Tax=Antrihabitans spumae TaxID=3373370 RepID=A0ABW7JYM1_9NOCA
MIEGHDAGRSADLAVSHPQGISLVLYRVRAVLDLIDRLGSTLDDISELRKSAQFIADNIAQLGESAAGIDKSAHDIARDIEGLSKSAAGIDSSAGLLANAMPVIQRLAEIVDPLESTVTRLGRFVDRMPGGRRAAKELDQTARPRSV